MGENRIPLPSEFPTGFPSNEVELKPTIEKIYEALDDALDKTEVPHIWDSSLNRRIVMFTPKDYYLMWKHGICTCCKFWSVTKFDGLSFENYSVSIGEGVFICGSCAIQDHHKQTATMNLLLEKIAKGAIEWRAQPSEGQ